MAEKLKMFSAVILPTALFMTLLSAAGARGVPHTPPPPPPPPPPPAPSIPGIPPITPVQPIPPIRIPAPPVIEPLEGSQSGTATSGLAQSANGPIVGVGSGVTNTVTGPGGAQAVTANSDLQGGGGFGFGQTSVVSTSERDGTLPVTARSTSTLVSTDNAALGTSQSSTQSLLPSRVVGQPSRVTSTHAQAAAIGTKNGFKQGQVHVGTISAGGTGGPQADIGELNV